MPNVKLTTADSAGFVPQFWAQRALDVLRGQIVLAQLTARDVDFTDPGWKGKSITVPYPGTFTAQDKVADTPITPQTPANGSSVTLTLNKHKVVGFSVEDFANAQANMSLMDRYIEPATIAVAEQFESDLWATTLSMGSVAPLGTISTGVGAAQIRAVMKALNDAKAPAPDRSLVVNTTDQGAILGDASLASFLAFSQPERIINGVVGKLYGLDTYWSNLVPASAARVTIGAATAGTFTLTVNSKATAAIAFNASPATVQAALATASISAAVSGAALASYSVVPTAADAGFAVTGNGAGLTGGSFAVAAANSNVAFHKNAVIFAVRPFAPIPSSAGVHVAQANDPESGLSIRITAQYDVNALAMRCNLDILYGMTVLRPNQGVVVQS